MTEAEMIEKLFRPSTKEHPAWPAFVEEMKEKQYGQEPLNQAWGFFRSGWEARKEAT